MLFLLCTLYLFWRLCSSFFFFKQKTAYEMRISDWSSDVCSSDLAVNNSKGRPLQFVVEAARDQPADDWIVDVLRGKHVTCRATVDAALGQPAMDALDDVAALAELAQRRLRPLGDDPLAWANLVGEAERFELAQAADLQRSEEHTSELQSLMRTSYAVF